MNIDSICYKLFTILSKFKYKVLVASLLVIFQEQIKLLEAYCPSILGNETVAGGVKLLFWGPQYLLILEMLTTSVQGSK
jgi:hypothetical protein